MVKFTATSDFNFDVSPVSIITDSRELTKRASAKELLKFERTPGQTDLHIIALGSYEGTGYNRNGDAFSEADCKANHHFFKQASRAVHRHHKNKPEDPKYGTIKASAYNEPMKRIELVIGLDNDKCADILAEQEKNGFTNWSMASKQAHDVCSWCGHKAKTDKDRCEHIPKNIGDLNKQGEMCGMLNPNPKWFEQSYVSRPADRIGMSLKVADQRIKPMLPSDYMALYTGFVPPDDELLLSKKASDKRELLRKLAEMEKHLDAVAKSPKGKTSKDQFIKRQSRLNKGPKIGDKDMDELRKHEPAKAFRGMADQNITMGPEEFLKYLYGNKAAPELAEGVKSHLPHAYSKMEEAGDAAPLHDEKFEPSPLDMLPKELKQLVGGLVQDHSIAAGPSVKRVMRITIEMGPQAHEEQDKSPFSEKEPTNNKVDEKLAEVYATYKLAALNHMREQGNLEEEVLWNALIQNR